MCVCVCVCVCDGWRRETAYDVVPTPPSTMDASSLLLILKIATIQVKNWKKVTSELLFDTW